VEYGGFRALVPGGAPLKALGELGSTGAQAIILGPADLETQTPADWQNFQPALVAFSRPGPAITAPGWQSLPALGWLDVSSDGKTVWVEAGR
jgi:hypothetical protein